MRTVEVPETPRDRLFRASRWHAVLLVLVCASACAAMIWRRWPAPRPSYYISAAILLLLFLLRGFITARFHPSNWLVRMSDEGLFLHFRSYLNEHLPAEDPTVFFLSFGDIRSARRVREWLTVRTMDNSSETQIHHYVELELAIDPTPLAQALAEECARPAVPEKRWYGTSSTLYRDYPVLMQSPPFLRLEWRVAPSAQAFLKGLRGRVEIAEPISVSQDFTGMQTLTRGEQDKRLRELDQRGQTMAAVYIARKLHAFDLTQATEYVKNLHGESNHE
jgi:hypothetical protein